ncbi:MAG: serine/threonine-protein kinase [Polyangiaceae bacterium]
MSNPPDSVSNAPTNALRSKKASKTTSPWPAAAGAYQLGPLINTGGMGVVFEAWHRETVRRVAVKFLSPRSQFPNAAVRFSREIFALRTLKHPHTVRLESWGRSEANQPWLAMEYVDGFSLAQLVTYEGAQSVKRTLELLRQICGSIGEVHELGMAHRDVKPANVMLTIQDHGQDWIKVVDFGLVKLPDELTAQPITLAGTLLGTPGYAPPEAWVSCEQVGLRGDVYGIGLIGYHLLTGRDPPDATEQRAQDSVAMVAELRERTPRWLVNVLARCLAQQPEQRYADANQLRRALNLPLHERKQSLALPD